MPQGIEDAVRTAQLPQPANADLYLSQYALASNTPIYITPGFGGSGAGPLPPIVTGTAHYDCTVTSYCDQAMQEENL